MVKTRDVFDLTHSSPVTVLGLIMCMGLRLSPLLLPVVTREWVLAQVSCSCSFLVKNFSHPIQAEHFDCFKESEIHCTCKHICLVKKTEHVNLIFADGELRNGRETTACTKTDSLPAMVTQEQVRQATTCKVFLHDCTFDLSNSSPKQQWSPFLFVIQL